MGRSPRVFAAAVTLLLAPAGPPVSTGECHVRGLLPDPSCTPGAVATTSLAIVCRTSTHGRRHVNRATRRRVLRSYALDPGQPADTYELDHLVPLELGGSNDVANLWPQAAPEFHDKDRVENALHARVCSGAMPLEAAQRAIASDWTHALR